MKNCSKFGNVSYRLLIWVQVEKDFLKWLMDCLIITNIYKKTKKGY